MAQRSLDTFRSYASVSKAGTSFNYYSVPAAFETAGISDRLPVCLKILVENLLRHEDGETVTADDIRTLMKWSETRSGGPEVAFFPRRVLMPDSSGVPLLADLAAMRDAVAEKGRDPKIVNPLVPVDIVIDHSTVAESAGTSSAFQENHAAEFRLNDERYRFIRWAGQAYRNLRILPPGNGIVHQVNLEYLASPVVEIEGDGGRIAVPDSLVGMDSHTPMVNSLAVFGWGVGGIEAAAVMLGEPISLQIPAVTGCRLTGRLQEGVSATDVVLTITQRLRAHGVVGRIVEYFGPGVRSLPLPHRATIANMSPEYGATMGFFPIDSETLRYLTETGRAKADTDRAEAYAKAQGLWAVDRADVYTDVVEIDLGAVEPSMAGPRRPQDRRRLSAVGAAFRTDLERDDLGSPDPHLAERELCDGDVAIAAITSCTNTANPALMVAAGLFARKARDRGLTAKPWVKTSFSPGSRVVSDYLGQLGLMEDLDALGFNVVGYGCMTCAGGSGPLKPVAEDAARQGTQLVAVLSGNRNFQGRIHPSIGSSFLGAPLLVVAHALAGTILYDLTCEPLGYDLDGKPVMLADLTPTDREVSDLFGTIQSSDIYRERYATMFEGDRSWNALDAGGGATYGWSIDSTYLRRPPFFDDMANDAKASEDVCGGRILMLLGDNVTTDDISPVSAISVATEAGDYLLSQGVERDKLHSYLARRVNHDVMLRGTFGNKHLKNEMVPGAPGGTTRLEPSGTVCSVFEAARQYRERGVPAVVIAGTEYGTGSSRDWAAKGTRLLGVRAVIAESFERIHRSNLVGMGVIPLQFPPGVNRKTLMLDGSETLDLLGLSAIAPQSPVRCVIHRASGEIREITLLSRIDTQRELAWLRSGGVLPFVMERMMNTAA